MAKTVRGAAPTLGANPAYVRADQARRRSGAAGVHGSRNTRRQRTRAARERAAIRDSW